MMNHNDDLAWREGLVVNLRDLHELRIDTRKDPLVFSVRIRIPMAP
jgi:hypothetical protein